MRSQLLAFCCFGIAAIPINRPRRTAPHACSQLGYNLCVVVLVVKMTALSLRSVSFVNLVKWIPWRGSERRWRRAPCHADFSLLPTLCTRAVHTDCGARPARARVCLSAGSVRQSCTEMKGHCRFLGRRKQGHGQVSRRQASLSASNCLALC